MSVAHVDDDDVSTTSDDEIYHAEKVFPNGDLYTGQWQNNLPHGHGKYLWTDGCMYVGDWFQGKTNGKGKFCWPSGAIYEGDFMKGYMDGMGTYTGPNGDTYRGTWSMNLKHGHGTKTFANGDYYDGEWRNGLQEGQGRYQWRNGNHYIGMWKNGVINGNGTMIWSNGNRYDGTWVNGLPKGNGTFRWADGSFYVGVWSKDPKEQHGTYYPSGSMTSENLDWDPQDLFAVDLNDCQVYPVDKVSVLPSQKMLECTPTDMEYMHKQSVYRPFRGNDASTRPRRSSVDGRVYDFNWDYNGDGVNVGGELRRLRIEYSDPKAVPSTPRRRLLKIQPAKRQGETISKGHRNYDLMLNLQLGIRHSVGRPAPATSLDLKPPAFDPKEKYWTRFPPEGSKHTPPHQSCEFRWKDYCPVVFRALRKLFKVDAADYMISICGNDALRELSSPGKSGSFFYLTNDDRYMIKTMKKSEVKVLLRMLPAYYNHVRAFENTLVTKFFGLHCVKLTGANQKKVRFVIMGNLFCSEYSIHRRFDLKGSSHGRITDKPDEKIEATTTLKDLDLNFIFRLHRVWFQEFCRWSTWVSSFNQHLSPEVRKSAYNKYKATLNWISLTSYIYLSWLLNSKAGTRKQVDKDCDFLEQERIMDYSLLVGLHFRQISYSKDSPTGEACPSVVQTPRGNENSARLSGVEIDQLLTDPDRWSSIRLGVGMPARAELTMRRIEGEPQLIGEPTGEIYDVILFFGIIDILQDYDISKKLEHAYKSFQYDPTSISAVDPRLYSRRFREFLYRVFVEDT